MSLLLRITYPENTAKAYGLATVETVESRHGLGGIAEDVVRMAEKIEVVDPEGNVRRVLKDRNGRTR